MNTKFLVLGLSLYIYSLPGQSQQAESVDLDNLRALAEHFVANHAQKPAGGRLAIEAGSIDQRIQLSACSPTKLEAFAPAGFRTNGNTTVGIRCHHPVQWVIYIPVKVRTLSKVLVATKALLRGQRITAADVMISEWDVSNNTRGYYQEFAEVEGMILRRPMKAGALIHGAALNNPLAIKRGQYVTIIATIGALTVRMKGTALSNGAEGDLIRVKNQKTEKVLEAQISAPGEVRVNL